MILPESLDINGNTTVTRELQVPGSPTLIRQGNTSIGAVITGTGSASPTNYQIRLNGRVAIGTFRSRVDAVTMPTVAVPPSPAGTRSVNVNGPGQNLGSWATIRNLTLNGNSGSYAVPAGNYGSFTAGGGSTFTIGVAGATTPSVYSFQSLTINGGGQIAVVGPVVVTIDTSLTMNGNSGTTANPFWLDLRLARCGVTLNGNVCLAANVTAPSGTVIINGGSRLEGSLICDRLTLNGNALLRLCDNTTPANQPPNALSQTLTTAEDNALAVTLTATDAENSTLTYSVLTQPAKGVLTGTPPALTYTPNANVSGTDSFTFHANDGTQNSDTATISLTITPVNDLPVAEAQSVSLAEDTPASIVLAASDVEGSALTYSVTTAPAHGTLSGTAPSLTYTPAADYHGTDSFVFRVNDGTADSALALVSLTITPVQDLPVASPLTASLLEDSSTTLALGGSDPDNDPLTAIVVTQPAHGTLGGTLPDLTYTPAENYFGADSFTYRVTDGSSNSAIVSVSLTVIGVNDAPVAQPKTVPLAEDTSAAFVLNASDVDGNPLAWTLVTTPAHGALSGTAPNLTYTPAPNFHGADGFTYSVSDGIESSDVVAVSFVVTPVNDGPVPVSDVATTPEDGPLQLVLRADDVDGDNLTWTLTTQPAHGTLSGTAPNLTYTPNANFSGTDSLSFEVTDGTVTATGTISIVVSPMNDLPTGQTLAFTGGEDGIFNFLLGGADADGDALTFTLLSMPAYGTLTDSLPSLSYVPNGNFHGTDGFSYVVSDGQGSSAPVTVTFTVTSINDVPEAHSQSLTTPEDTALPVTLAGTDADGDALTHVILSQPSHGTLSGAAPNLSYTPATNYSGADSFTYKVNDGTADSATATISISVGPINDRPAVNPIAVTTAEDEGVEIEPEAFDLDGDELTLSALTQPGHGTLTATASGWLYTPNANYNGTDSFSYRANDGLADSDAAIVTITITAVNDAPLAQAQSLTLDEDDVASVTLLGSDVEGSALTFEILTQPAHGTLSGAAPNLVYTPAAHFHGADSFTFRVNDGDLNSTPATISLQVESINDAPVADSQNLSLDEDGSLAITLDATDGDEDTLTYTLTQLPAHGTLSGTAPNVIYAPEANFHGTDSFAFTVSDGTAASSPAYVNLTIQPVNDTPVAQAASFTTNEDTAASIVLQATDIDEDTLTYTLVTQPAHGQISGTAPSLTYTPEANYHGADSFTFTVNDGTVDSTTVQISLTVQPVNDAPEAIAGTLTTPEDTSAALVLTATDAENEALTAQITLQPQHGTLSGTWPNYTYAPEANSHGTDEVRFRVSDGQAFSNIAAVVITVTPVNDAPTALAFAASTPEDTALPLVLTGNDVDGDTLTYAVTQQPQHGTLSGTAPNLTYTPEQNYHGPDSLAFTVSDGADTSAAALVTLTVGPENDAPEAYPLAFTLDEDSSVAITADGSDLDGDEITFEAVTTPQHGSLVATAEGWIYTPEANYHGSDSFTYRANDGLADSAPALVTLTIESVNDTPVANAVALSTDEDTALTGTLTGGDVDEDTLTFAISTAPQHGQVLLIDGDFTYTPHANLHGGDSFSFTVNDGTTSSTPALVSITVNPVNDVPVANATSITLAEDGSTLITLTGSDTENQTLTYLLVSQPGHGTLTGFAPHLTYTPEVDFHGADSFSFRVNDGLADSALATVSITVESVNDTPAAVAQSITVDEDSSAPVTLAGTDVDADSLTYTVTVPPAHGSLTGTAPNLIYTPNADYASTDTFSFTANDGTATSAAAVVSITVSPINDAPEAENVIATTAEDTPLSIVLPGSDPDQDALTYILSTLPTHGTVALIDDTVTYTPDADFHGADSFGFKVSDGQVLSAEATVQVTITPVNDAPVAQNLSVAGIEDTATQITLTGSDVDGDTLSYELLTAPAHGTATLAGSVVTYTPHAQFHGADSFTFRTSDGTLASASATVEIHVAPRNDAPVALAQEVTTQEDTAVPFVITGTDIDGDVLTYAIVTQPAHGTLSGTAPNLTYTPAADFNGSDSFTFTVADAELTSPPAAVTLVVGSENDAPVASPVTVTLAEDTPTTISAIVSDPENDTTTLQTIIQPAHGTLASTAGGWVYTPDANYFGSDSFTYRANDGMADSAPAVVTLTVTPVNDTPLAAAQSVNAVEDTSTLITLSGSDVEDSTLVFTIVSQPQHGTLLPSGTQWAYQPAADYHGSDAFTFTVTDSEGLVSIAATVSVTVNPVNDAPVALAQSLTTPEDTSLGITLTASDIENEALTYEVLSQPQHGSLSGTAPHLTYTPTANYHGSESFTFRVNDGTADSAQATINLTITSVNDTPVAAAQAVTSSEDTATSITLTGTDADGDTLTYAVSDQPQHGTLSGTAPELTYTPDANFHGSDSFSFTANDGTVSSAAAAVTLTITAENDAPMALAQSLGSAEDTALPVTLTATDADEDDLTYTVVTQPSHGVLSGTGAALTYTPAANYSGPDLFTFRASDGTASSAVASVEIVISPVNDAPVANAVTASTAEDTFVDILLTGTDVEGSALTFELTSAPEHGAVSLTGSVARYTPATNYHGADSFEFRAFDGAAHSAPVSASITITPANDAPLAVSQQASTPEDTALPLTLLGTDTDGDALTYAITSPPQHGALSGAAPNIIYTPAANYHGADSFAFTVSDADATSASALVILEIGPINDAPYVSDITVALDEDTTTEITPEGDDFDADELTFDIVAAPQHGSLTATATGWIYTPAADYHGADSFTYRANDGLADSAPALVSITVRPVNDAPTATTQSLVAVEDTPLSITLSGSDPENTALTFAITSQPSHGTVTVAGAAWTYTPALNYSGADSFTFTVTDEGGLASAPATVSLTVTPVNDAPSAQAQQLTLAEDTSLPVTLTGSDVDDAELTYTVLTAPAHGVLSGTLPALTYTPNADYHGTDSLVFIAQDGETDSVPATISLVITPVNDAPVALAQAVNAQEEIPLPITLTGTDADGDTLTYTITTQPAHGTLTGTGAQVTYQASANYFGADSFAFTVSDGTATSAAAQISISVTGINDAPVIATVPALTTNEDTALAGSLTVTDADEDPVTVAVTTAPTHGQVVFNGLSFTYTPGLNYHGSDSFAVKASDGELESAERVVSITVTPVNDAPVAANQSLVYVNGTPLFLPFAATDVDGDALTYRVVTPPTKGQVTALPRGTSFDLAYLPNAGGSGDDTVAFVANDGHVDSNQGIVTITLGSLFTSKTWTTTADFYEGSLDGLGAVGDKLAMELNAKSINFVHVPLNDGRLLRIDPDSGQIIGEFRTSPDGEHSLPSRTAVDQEGNLWVANRATNSLTMIAAPGSGRWVDRNGNGKLDTSTGIMDRKAWPVGGQPVDELIVTHVTLQVTTPNSLAVSYDNRVLVGGGGGWQWLSWPAANTLEIEPHRNLGGYGSIISTQGVHWSAGKFLRWPLSQKLAEVDLNGSWNDGTTPWCVAEAPDGHIWTASEPGAEVRKYTSDGRLVGKYKHGWPDAQGIVADHRGHIWVAHTHCGSTVGHLLPDGTLVGVVRTAGGPVAVDVDRSGRVWVIASRFIQRVDTNGGPFGSDGVTRLGAVDLTIPLPETSRAHSQFARPGQVLHSTEGTWTGVFDSGIVGAAWEPVRWNADVCNDGLVEVSAALSADGVTFGASQALTSLGAAPAGAGRYIQVQVHMAQNGSLVSPALKDITVGTTGAPVPVPAAGWSASAGDDFEASWPTPMKLRGQFCHADQPGYEAATYLWTKVSGPGQLIVNGSGPEPLVNFTASGDYVLRFSVTVDGLTQTDDVNVKLRPVNQPPAISLRQRHYLRGFSDVFQIRPEITDDGQGSAALSATWQLLSGPPGATATFTAVPASGVGAVDVTIGGSTSFPYSGLAEYLFKVTATDGQLANTQVISMRRALINASEAPSGMISWWEMNDAGEEHVHGNTIFPEQNARFVTNSGTRALELLGTNDRARAFASESLNSSVNGQGFSFEFWINDAQSTTGNYTTVRPIMGWSSATGYTTHLAMTRTSASVGTLNLKLLGLDGATRDLVGTIPSTTLTGSYPLMHVVATYDSATKTANLMVNDVVIATQTFSSLILDTSGDFVLGSPVSGGASFGGYLKHVRLYDRALTEDESYTIWKGALDGMSPPDNNTPPVPSAGEDIVFQPENYNLVANGQGVWPVISITGSVSDDGRTNLTPGTKTTWRFIYPRSNISGAGTTPPFSNVNGLTTDVTIYSSGVYLLELTAEDGSFTRRDYRVLRAGRLTNSSSGGGAGSVSPDLLAWWPFMEGSRYDIIGQKPVDLHYDAVLDDTKLTFDGARDYGQVAPSPTFDFTDKPGFSMEFNSVDSNQTTGPISGDAWFAWQKSGQNVISLRRFYLGGSSWKLRVDGFKADGQPFFLEAPWTVVSNAGNNYSEYHHSWTYDRATGRMALAQNGYVRAEAIVGDIRLPDAATTLYIGGVPGEAVSMKGWLDDVCIYGRSLSDQDTYDISRYNNVGKQLFITNKAPVVNAGPDLILGNGPQTINLQGLVTDDGLPVGYPIKSTWSMLRTSYGGSVPFANINSPTSSITLPANGTYLMQLMADDGERYSTDIVHIQVGSQARSPVPDGAVAWWPFDGSSKDVIQGINAELRYGARMIVSWPGGGSGLMLTLGSPSSNATDHAFVSPNAGLDFTGTDGFTCEFWATDQSAVTATAPNNKVPVITWHNGQQVTLQLSRQYNATAGSSQYLTLEYRNAQGQMQSIGAVRPLYTSIQGFATTPLHVAITHDKATGELVLYAGGTVLASVISPGIQMPSSSDTMYLGTAPGTTLNQSGIIDELTLYNRALSFFEINEINNIPSAWGKLADDGNLAPVVDAGPNRDVLTSGGSITLTGTVTDDGLPSNSTVRTTWSVIDYPGSTPTLGTPNATSTTMTVPSDGYYILQLSADDGTRISKDTVIVRVGRNAGIKAPTGLAAWWPFNGDGSELVRNMKAELSSGVEFNSYAGVNGHLTLVGSDIVHVPADHTLDFSSSPGFSVEFGLQDSMQFSSGTALPRVIPWLTWSNGSQVVLRIKRHSTTIGDLGRQGVITLEYLTSAGVPQSVSLSPNQRWDFSRFLLTYDKASGTASLYSNGLVIGTAQIGSIQLPSATSEMNVGWKPNMDTQQFSGYVDELSLYARALTADESALLASATVWGKEPLDGNQAPLALTGGNFSGSSGTNVPITSTASDDGLPAAYGLATKWTSVTTGSSVTFGNSAAQNTTFNSFSSMGLAVLRQDAQDGALTTPAYAEFRFTNTSAAAVPANLVAWWPFNVSLYDVAGTNHLVTTYGRPAWAGDSLVGAHVSFDGTDDRLVITPNAAISFTGAPGFTAEALVYDNASHVAGSEVPWLVWHDGTRAIMRLHRITTSSSTDYYGTMALDYIDSTNTEQTILLTPSERADTRRHIALTYDATSGEIRYYSAGTLKSTTTVGSIRLPAGTDTLHIANAPGDTRFWRGGIDELSLYSRALTQTEINGLVTASTARQGKVSPARNQTPQVKINVPLTVRVGDIVNITANAQDDGLPAGSSLSYAWTISSGPFSVTPSSATSASTTAVFAEAGIHRIECAVSEGQRTGLGSVDIRVLPPLVNVTPSVTLSAPAIVQLPASGHASVVATDDALPAGSSLSYTWSKVSGPGTVTFSASTSAATQMTFSLAGTYVIAAAVSDGDLTTNVQATVTVQAAPPNRAPTISWISPSPTTALITNQSLTLKAAAQDVDDNITHVQFFDGSTLLATDTTQPYEHTITNVAEGPHAYSAKVTSAGGQTATTVTLALTALTPEDPNHEEIVIITAPTDGTVITAPTSIRATIDVQNGYRWVLQRRLTGARNAIWQTFATGEYSGILTDQAISSFDPTLLENGSWDIKLQAHKRNGVYYETVPTTVQVDGAMKLGQFTLAFEDFTLDVPGIPISVTRSYDSRIAATGRPGDFGPGWRVGMRSVTISKSGTLGEGWYHSLAGFADVSWFPLPIYNLSPVGKKRVVVTFPDGRCEIFETTVVTANSSGITVGPVSIPATDSSNQYGSPINVANIGFKPVGPSRGTLRIAGTESASRFVNVGGALGDVDLRLESNLFNTFDASTFIFTDDDGTEYTINESTGLQKVRDRNANELTIATNQIAHSNGQKVLFTRDTAGRVTAITDPAGKQILYTYNTLGTLGTVTDRVNNVTTFQYQNSSFPYYLTGIIDPRGIQAIRTEYDTAGRMIRQLDADGNPIQIQHNVTARTQRITDRLGHATVHTFDERGNITRTVDALGGVILRTYDANDREITTTDPLGHTTSRTYDAQNNVLTETNPLGHITRYTYNSKKQPLTITDPLGRVTSMAYDNQGNMTSETDALGRTTGFVPTSNGSISRLQVPGGMTYDFTLDGNGNRTSQIMRGTDGKVAAYQTFTYNSVGDTTGQSDYLVPANATDVVAATKLRDNVHTYDAEGNMTATQIRDALGNVLQSQSWTYNANGDEVTYTDPMGKVSTEEYDNQGRSIRSTYTDNTESQLEYDAEGNITRSVNRSGGVMTYEFDALGRQTQISNVDGTFSTVVFDAAGREISKTNELGQTTTLTYDDADHLLTETNAAGETVTHTLDAADQNTAVTDALNRTTSTVLDLVGRPTRITHPDGSFTSIGYNSANQAITRTDEAGNTTHFDYDPQGRLLGVVDAMNHGTNMVYDSVGRLQSWTDAEGNSTSYTHDTLGRRTSRTLPGNQTEHFTWDSMGRLQTHTDFNGFTTSYFYDADHYLVEKRADPGHPSLSLPHAAAKVLFTYNAFGEPATAEVRNANGTVIHSQIWSYDDYGRLTGTSTPHGNLGYTHDGLGQVSGLATSHAEGPQLAYERDDANRLAAINDLRTQPSKQTSYGYTLTGALNQMTAANGMRHSMTYNTRDFVNSLNVTDAASAGIESFNYTLNALGQRERIDEGNGRVVQFQRDPLGRLTHEQISNAGPASSGILGYSHNSVGYRTARTSTQPAVPAQSLTLNANGQVAGVSYDSNGNTLAANGNTDVYDFEDRLIRRTKLDGTIIDFVYDANGQRVEKRMTGRQPLGYLIDTQSPSGWPQCVAEVAWTGTEWQPLTTYTYGAAGPISQWNHIQGEHYFLRDAHGSIRALVDANGQVVSAMDYDSHGVPLSVTPAGAPKSALGYNGEHFDADLGLVYLRARWYDPMLGRFHTRDPYQGMFEDPMSLQGYLFAHGDPESFIDPSGNLTLADALTTLRIQIKRINDSIVKLDKIVNPAIQVVTAIEVLKNYASTGDSILQHGFQGKPGDFFKWGRMTLSMLPALKYQYAQLKILKNEKQKSGAVNSLRRWSYFGQLQKALATSKRNAIASGHTFIVKSNGLPDLTPNASASIFLKGGLTGRRSTDNTRSQAQARRATGTWHHHEVMGIMQSVDVTAHSAVSHHGGVYFWSLCNNKTYKK
ncbi:Ig-like domain-containing protein [Brevifollis gellanilyticus]|uniref:PKD domain-containing protein n=1 Tax=Brevifollis gellanilyticus TaxID=748831 RepID=A0A512M9T4_9BACT|nr:Ig-like domain-containing protein [Brevifollis gellanilyticus]GEP43499.1 hypothetical protein BGE01nite_27900 [Brevifollis gellanilyticus]